MTGWPRFDVNVALRRLLALTFVLACIGATPVFATSGPTDERPAEKPVFSGVMTHRTRTVLLLTQDSASRWVEVGRAFGTFHVESYDPNSDTATLTTAAGEKIVLPLKQSRVDAGSAAIATAPADARRAFWEKIKDLDGDELIHALKKPAANSGKTAHAFTYLTEQDARLHREAAAAKLAVERAALTTAATEEDRVSLSAAQRKYDTAVANAASLRDRLEQIALHRKKELCDSLATP